MRCSPLVESFLFPCPTEKLLFWVAKVKNHVILRSHGRRHGMSQKQQQSNAKAHKGA